MRSGRSAAPPRPDQVFVAEVVAGIEEFARDELLRVGAGRCEVGPGEIGFSFAGDWRRLLALKTVVAAYAVVARGLPRPSALLDDGAFKLLVSAVERVVGFEPGSFATFRISAAGSGSAVLARVRDRLAAAVDLEPVGTGGDLLLRLRREPRAPGGEPGGFELLLRISPRPLSARGWRVCNRPGALNATIASVMARLSIPRADDVFLNLGSGSGTLLIERALLGSAGRLIGCDTDVSALECAARNVAAAGLGAVELHGWDATALSLADGSITALVADLPFGQLVGSPAENASLYPRLVSEAARVAAPDARFVAISQQTRLLERCIAGEPRWELEQRLRVRLPTRGGTISPEIFVARRAPRSDGGNHKGTKPQSHE